MYTALLWLWVWLVTGGISAVGPALGPAAAGVGFGAGSGLTAAARLQEPRPVAEAERFIRRVGKTIRGAVTRWGEWLPRALLYLVAALLMPLVDWSLIAALVRGGWRTAAEQAALALIVYARLLLDRRTPALGKVLVGFGVLYGVALRDLLPDAVSFSGQLDDFLVLLVGARAVMLICPGGVLEEHARVAATRLRGNAGQ